MLTENLKLGVSLVLCGALVIAGCLPLLKGYIKPNAFYGIRMSKSFESDENWFKMNHYGARQLMLWAGVTILVGFLSFLLPLHGDKNLVAVLGFSPGVIYACRSVPNLSLLQNIVICVKVPVAPTKKVGRFTAPSA